VYFYPSYSIWSSTYNRFLETAHICLKIHFGLTASYFKFNWNLFKVDDATYGTESVLWIFRVTLQTCAVLEVVEQGPWA